MTGGSLGLQAGVKSADVVLFLTGEDAKSRLREGNFRIGGEMTATAGSYDRTFRAPNSNVVSYSRSEGWFAGVAVDGVSITRDRDDDVEFYGTKDPSLTAKLSAERERLVSDLRSVLPEHVG
jgi:lipid-binding SYLF domain-containing protein